MLTISQISVDVSVIIEHDVFIVMFHGNIDRNLTNRQHYFMDKI